jgi:hypothetical protein
VVAVPGLWSGLRDGVPRCGAVLAMAGPISNAARTQLFDREHLPA